MGVIIKYRINFGNEDLLLSNGLSSVSDLYAVDYIIDVDVDVRMMRGSPGCTFTLSLHDLPLEAAKKLNEEFLKRDVMLPVKVELGYVDGDFSEVVKGIVTKISSKVQGNSLVTTVKGAESATHVLKKTKFDDFKEVFDGDRTPEEMIRTLLGKVEQSDLIQKTPKLYDLSTDTIPDRTWTGANLLTVLNNIAHEAGAEFLVGDGKVHVGKPILCDLGEVVFHVDDNLARFEPFSKDLPDKDSLNLIEPTTGCKVQGFEFVVTGDPALRPGQKVVPKLDGYDEKSASDFRIHSIRHVYSVKQGYYCKGAAVKVGEDASCGDTGSDLDSPSADAIISRLEERAASELTKKPAVDIAKVKEYEPPPMHRASLYYNQRFSRSEPQPSIRTDVDTDDKQVYLRKPILSPFAWNRCGLTVPVYPGMKAAVAHNLHLRDDGLLMGFLWSEEPKIEPPSNNEGDWWLCLPIDFDTSSPPNDSTKAVSDLTANNGRRVISAKGLKISIGQDLLTQVGERPSEGADDELLIEHSKGTTVTIASDGKVTIEASDISIKGNVEIQGNVDVK